MASGSRSSRSPFRSFGANRFNWSPANDSAAVAGFLRRSIPAPSQTPSAPDHTSLHRCQSNIGSASIDYGPYRFGPEASISRVTSPTR